MRILHLVYGSKWTGPAAVAIDQVRALRLAGIEAQIALVAPGNLAERLAEQGWARPLLSQAKSPGRFLADALRLRETVRRERFVIIHCHQAHDHLLALCALSNSQSRLTAVGLRLSELDPKPQSRKPKAESAVLIVRTIHHQRHVRRDPLTRAVFRHTRAFAFSNSAIAVKFLEHYGDARPVAVLPPVVDLDRFRPGPKDAALAASLGLSPGRFVLMTIGKMASGRGFDVAIEALARTARKEIVLLHVGKGEEQPRLMAQAKRLGVADRNIWTGYQEEKLPEFYRLADAFLFTASGSDQGHRAILEAMSSGLPVVALDLPGVADLLPQNGPGLIVTVTGDLSGCLDHLAVHRELCLALSRAGRSRAEEFSASRFADRAARFYATLEKGITT